MHRLRCPRTEERFHHGRRARLRETAVSLAITSEHIISLCSNANLSIALVATLLHYADASHQCIALLHISLPHLIAKPNDLNVTSQVLILQNQHPQ